MSAPEIKECRIVQRTTCYDRDVIRPKEYAFSEILMTDVHGQQYCSRTWDKLDDSPHARAHQVEQFKKRWEANERAGY